MGASQIPVPIYQYRIILPFDDKVINVATDMDFNVEGDIKAPITKNVLAKSSFLVLRRYFASSVLLRSPMKIFNVCCLFAVGGKEEFDRRD